MANPKITLTAGTAPAEGGTKGVYNLTLDSAAPAGGLVINFNITGTATSGTDYTLVAGTNISNVTATSLTIAAGATSAVLNVNALADNVTDAGETVKLNLAAGTGYTLDQTSFANKVDYATAAGPYYVTTADFNKDGKLDIITANSGGISVSTLLGNGDGTFQAKTDIGGLGGQPVYVSVSDFNGDNNPDIAVAYYNVGKIGVMLGNGAGGFGAATNYNVGVNPYSSATGDFNSDGKVDLVVPNSGTNNISLLLGNGDGSFQAKVDTSISVGGSNPRPTAIVSADFNGDGKIDIATANDSMGNVSVLLSNGNGTFQAKTDYAVGARPLGITTADFDHDGKADIATANLGSSNISVLLSSTNFATATNVALTTGSQPFGIQVGDFNSDGWADIVTANNVASGTSSVALNNGNGTFTVSNSLTVGGLPYSVSTGDFNNDGKSDVQGFQLKIVTKYYELYIEDRVTVFV